MGSGCVCAMSILEEGYKDDMSREDAIDLAVRAIKAGIYHDNASGSNVDICVITKEKLEMFRPYEKLQQKTRERTFPVVFEKGRTSEYTPEFRSGTSSLGFSVFRHQVLLVSYSGIGRVRHPLF